MKIKLLTLLLLVLTAPAAMAQKADKATPAIAKEKGNDQLKGNYTSAENPDGVLIYTQGEKLMGKIPGEPSFTIEHTNDNSYKASTGILLHFIPEAKQLIVQRDRTREVLTKS